MASVFTGSWVTRSALPPTTKCHGETPSPSVTANSKAAQSDTEPMATIHLSLLHTHTVPYTCGHDVTPPVPCGVPHSLPLGHSTAVTAGPSSKQASKHQGSRAPGAPISPTPVLWWAAEAGRGQFLRLRPSDPSTLTLLRQLAAAAGGGGGGRGGGQGRSSSDACCSRSSATRRSKGGTEMAGSGMCSAITQ